MNRVFSVLIHNSHTNKGDRFWSPLFMDEVDGNYLTMSLAEA